MNRGQIQRFDFQSKLLANNRSGDSSIRPVTCYLPHRGSSSDKVPTIYLLSSWTNAGRTAFDWRPFRESLSDRLDRLINSQTLPPIAVVSVDLFSQYGGSQHIDSTFFGAHASHIVNELIPFCESKLPIVPGADHRAVAGRSSGGFGALRFAFDFPGVFSRVACHSGDMGFELLYGGDLVTFCNKLAYFDHSVEKFTQYAFKSSKLTGSDIHMLMLLGMAGFYSPNEKSLLGFDLPIDLKTGAINQSVWQKWLDHDPIRLASARVEPLRQLDALYFDCGNRDQYHLQYGARQLQQTLVTGQINHHYEEFNGDHSGTEYRYDVSFPIISVGWQR